MRCSGGQPGGAMVAVAGRTDARVGDLVSKGVHRQGDGSRGQRAVVRVALLGCSATGIRGELGLTVSRGAAPTDWEQMDSGKWAVTVRESG
jgi:hypothetical protein